MAILKTLVAAFLITLVVVSGSAVAERGNSSGTVRFNDATGVEHSPMHDCRRIISLAPNLTEMAYYLDLGDRMVGRTDYCNYPPEAAGLASIGGFVDASLEKIVQLNPDLVLAYRGNSLELIGQLRRLRIRVLVFDEARQLSNILDDMVVLAAVATGSADGCQEPVQNWDQQLQILEAQANKGLPGTDRNRPTVFFGYPGDTSISCGNSSFLNDLIDLAGAKNICASLNEPWPSVSTEFILAADPEFIISASSCAEGQSRSKAQQDIKADLEKRAAWKTLTAVKAGRVIVFDSDILLRPGPRILEAGFELASYIEAFKAVK